MLCCNCHKELADGARFCKYCGTRQDPAAAGSTPMPGKIPPVSKPVQPAPSAPKAAASTPVSTAAAMPEKPAAPQKPAASTPAADHSTKKEPSPAPASNNVFDLQKVLAELNAPAAPAKKKAEPIAQPKAEPLPQPKAEPVVQPKTEPAVQPKAEPLPQPKAEPVVQPVQSGERSALIWRGAIIAAELLVIALLAFHLF